MYMASFNYNPSQLGNIKGSRGNVEAITKEAHCKLLNVSETLTLGCCCRYFESSFAHQVQELFVAVTRAVGVGVMTN